MPLFGRRSGQGAGAPEEVRATFELRVRLLSAEEVGRQQPVASGYRPQLSIGQRLRDGQPVFWDCEWTSARPLRLYPGEEGSVTARLAGLPDLVLREDEYLEFFEDDTLVATGVVTAIHAPSIAR